MKRIGLVWIAVLLSLACEKGKKADNSGASALPAQSEAEKNEVLAQIDTYKITIGDFEDRINKQSPYIRQRYTSLERKKEFLDNLIRFEVLASEAKTQGLDTDAEVVRTMKQVMIQKLMKKEFETRVKLEDITDAEVKTFYDQNTAEYNKPEEVRVSAIVLGDKASAAKVAKEALGPKGQDNRGFRELVTTYSVDAASKPSGGDLRYFPADTAQYPAPVVKAAFSLAKTGDVTGPIEAAGKFYILKQTGRRKALTKTLEEVKRQIQNRIYRDKRTKAMEDYVTDLRNKAKIQVFEDKLAKVRVDATMPATPGGMMGPGGPMMGPGGPAGPMGAHAEPMSSPPPGQADPGE